MTHDPSLPVLRLKPKADAKAIRFGSPWVRSDELVLDRRAKTIAPGTLCELQDAERTPLALIAASPAAKIAGRVLSLDVSTQIDQAWFEDRIRAALSLRERAFDTPFYRLVHAEGDNLPGLIIDRFDETLVMQPNAAWLESHLEMLTAALIAVTGATNIVKNASSRARALDALDDVTEVLAGAPAQRVLVPMNGATYVADLAEGQKTGLFYDQRPNHALAARFAKDASVLDMFSHVGGFALAALAHGARDALAVDGSAPALALAEEGAAAMDMGDKLTTLKADAFAALDDLASQGRTFELVICDPPAFAPNKMALGAGLRAYERVARAAAQLVAPGGILMLCSCSHAATVEKFRGSCLRGIGRGGRAGALIYTGYAGPDHPVHPNLSDTGYLKALAFRLT